MIWVYSNEKKKKKKVIESAFYLDWERDFEQNKVAEGN
jgi:hypothetical protein